MKALSLIKKLILVTLSALIGAIVFYSFSMALFYIAKSIFPDNIAEAAPPFWIGLWLIVVLLGMGLSAVFGGFWGYSRYCKPLTHL